jgi:beta-barrel assembly-enhancing protease
MKRLTILLTAFCCCACAVSQQDEIQMGQQYSAQIAQQMPLVSDPEVVRYVNVLGDSIAKLTLRSDLDWHFYVVDTKEVNAFAIPGGYVYVNRGLIERADQMDELAGVLGHEIGHVVMRHSVKQMQQAQKAGIGITLVCILTGVCNTPGAGTLINNGANAVFAKFSRTDEKEADDQGFQNVVRAGISPAGMVTMFQKLLQERKDKPAGVDAWFQTHPLEEDRIVDIQSQINRLPSSTMSSLATDSRNFHVFKDRLLSLPPSPPPRRQ